jgi:hypothetical protein
MGYSNCLRICSTSVSAKSALNILESRSVNLNKHDSFLFYISRMCVSLGLRESHRPSSIEAMVTRLLHFSLDEHYLKMIGVSCAQMTADSHCAPSRRVLLTIDSGPCCNKQLAYHLLFPSGSQLESGLHLGPSSETFHPPSVTRVSHARAAIFTQSTCNTITLFHFVFTHPFRS